MTDLITRAREILKRVEWNGDFCDGPACPECLGAPWNGHSEDCALGAWLAVTHD